VPNEFVGFAGDKRGFGKFLKVFYGLFLAGKVDLFFPSKKIKGVKILAMTYYKTIVRICRFLKVDLLYVGIKEFE